MGRLWGGGASKKDPDQLEPLLWASTGRKSETKKKRKKSDGRQRREGDGGVKVLQDV